MEKVRLGISVAQGKGIVKNLRIYVQLSLTNLMRITMGIEIKLGMGMTVGMGIKMGMNCENVGN